MGCTTGGSECADFGAGRIGLRTLSANVGERSVVASFESAAGQGIHWSQICTARGYAAVFTLTTQLFQATLFGNKRATFVPPRPKRRCKKRCRGV
jgi:hypothetical protein